ncbi:MAG: type II toxin-antitoxin system PemK/MazF family toxin [Aurantimonas endophytica]|uniref:mRNA interferase MazF n=1 Tax=Aurantimonas endophytica TaxID=1522175 RepID=A0A7W6HHF1_9HYPH|nr:type II toxin-antitoxin system PemK/MazF family toxin [Aurantimonas endophytica]MBB4005007.1 mRNA interferase MazF [Aurantimonas endophytica]MCO6405813.1 type II toxin-antitoxin system PemK/MazF family toxin [Aurantimonas endophytica]
MKRGDVVLVSGKGDYGKSRPAVVVQADYFAEYLGSLTVVPFTSDVASEISIRVTIEANAANGLREKSQLMTDKIQTYPRAKVFGPIGTLEADQMVQLDRALIVFLQLAATLFASSPTVPLSSQGTDP